MAVLVHITKAENKKSILRSGIKVGKYSKSLYFMPHTQNFLISHQWARELKRCGVKNFIAIDFRLPKIEEVWFGKYFEGHKKLPLNIAIEIFLAQDDKYGYEFILERKVEAKEIINTRIIQKPMGWRYEPNSHGKQPCPCPMCILRGGYRTSGLKEKNDSNISRQKAQIILKESHDDNELVEALERMQGKWRKESPEYLKRLINSQDEYVLYSLVELLAQYRHPLAKEYLTILANNEDEDSSQLARQCLEKI